MKKLLVFLCLVFISCQLYAQAGLMGFRINTRPVTWFMSESDNVDIYDIDRHRSLSIFTNKEFGQSDFLRFRAEFNLNHSWSSTTRNNSINRSSGHTQKSHNAAIASGIGTEIWSSKLFSFMMVGELGVRWYSRSRRWSNSNQFFSVNSYTQSGALSISPRTVGLELSVIPTLQWKVTRTLSILWEMPMGPAWSITQGNAYSTTTTYTADVPRGTTIETHSTIRSQSIIFSPPRHIITIGLNIFGKKGK